jgi:hypothetical protein
LFSPLRAPSFAYDISVLARQANNCTAFPCPIGQYAYFAGQAGCICAPIPCSGTACEIGFAHPANEDPVTGACPCLPIPCAGKVECDAGWFLSEYEIPGTGQCLCYPPEDACDSLKCPKNEVPYYDIASRGCACEAFKSTCPEKAPNGDCI